MYISSLRYQKRKGSLVQALVLFISFFFYTAQINAQPNAGEWVWLGGDSANLDKELFGEFGIKGVESPLNFPGARNRNISWTDATGNFWMMGGNGYDASGNTGLLNDLWRWNTITSQWTWVSGSNTFNQQTVYGTKGIASAANIPGARQGSVSWADAAGNLWLFGGQGYAAASTTGSLNDLWKYNIASAQWTWVSGSNTTNQIGVYGTKGVASAANIPGARQGAVGWADASGNFWLMGGENSSSSRFNDLWKYNPASNEWAWVSGTTLFNQLGAFGTKGVASPSNLPGARHSAFGFRDAAGNLWLAGGTGFASTTSAGLLNDVWKYDITTDQWTWVTGSDLTNQNGVYGTKGVAAPTNIPGARLGSFFWVDGSGNFFLSGGVGQTGRFNDLWKYNPTSNEWTWLSGSNTLNQPGIYGTKGVASATNIPGAREYGSEWADASGNLWLWGGSGLNRLGTSTVLCDLWKYNITSNQWTWVGGSNAVFQVGIYGTKGVASPTNKPGARRSAINWTDANGNFWLMGGLGFAESGSPNYLNDLWRYNTTTAQWTWISGSNTTNQTGVYGTKGVAAAANVPGARQSAVSWVDAAGNFWIMGGFNGSGYLNDLWRYNTTTGQWTWISGSNTTNQNGAYGTKGVASATNIPGARQSSVSWSDKNGNFWLMGGFGRSGANTTGLLNDLWKYDLSLNQWVWIGGSAVTNQAGFYGTQGVAGSGQPGARQEAFRWTDQDGNFWLMGGFGLDESGTQGLLNDLWKFDAIAGLWTWVKGSALSNRNGIYGTKGIGATANNPGGRQSSTSWVDGVGNFWLFGGSGLGNTGTAADFLNDSWKFNPVTNQWTWMGGENNIFPSYNYGSLGVSSPNNIPVARNTSAGWVDKNSNLWLMGGYSRYNNQSNFIFSNDLWRYTISCEISTNFSINNTTQCFTGNNFIFSNNSTANAGPLSFKWFFGDGASSTAENPVHSYPATGVYFVKLVATGNGCSDSLVQNVTVDLPVAAITASGPLSFCEGASVLLSAGNTPGTNYQWKKNNVDINNATSSTYEASSSGAYTVQVTNTALSCTNISASVLVTVKPIPPKPVITVNGSDLISSSTIGNQWYLGGALIFGATAQTYRPLQTGPYTVRLTVDGCTGDFSDPVNYVITGVNNLSPGEFIKIGPNPVKNQVQIFWKLLQNPLLSVTIYNTKGQLVKQQLNCNSGVMILTSDLAAGVYWLQLENRIAKKKFIYKIVKGE